MRITSRIGLFSVTFIIVSFLLSMNIATAAQRSNFTAEQRAAVLAAINLIRDVGFTAHADNLFQMLDGNITHPDGSTSGLKELHKDTDPSYTAKGTTTGYQGSGGKVTGCIRINDDLLDISRQIDLAATLVHEKTHVMRLEKENSLKAWNMGAIYDTVNDYIRSCGNDKDAAREKLVDDLANEESKEKPDEKKVKHLKAALDLIDKGPYTNWIELEAYYTELKFLLTVVRKGFAEYDDVKGLIEDVIGNCERHEGNMKPGVRNQFTAIDSDTTASAIDKVDKKIQFLDGQLTGVDGQVTAMATAYSKLVGDPVTVTLGSAGGTFSLTLPGNTSGVADITVTIPSGALSADTAFRIDEQTEYCLAGWIWIHAPASDGFFVHPDGLMFSDDKAATITLRYDAKHDPADLDVYQLPLSKPNDGRWEKLDAGRTVNETQGTISVTSTQLGVYAVLKDTPWLNTTLSQTIQGITGSEELSITVIAPDGSTLDEDKVTVLTASDPALTQEGKPAAEFPHGIVCVTVTTASAGDEITVITDYPETLASDAAFYMVDSAGFHLFSGAEIDGGTVRLVVSDGGADDGDGEKNGVILFCGGPAEPAAGGSGGGGCFIMELMK